jgi:hypothetical protein
MSQTLFYAIPENGSVIRIGAARNGWDSAPPIWDYIGTKYLGWAEGEFWTRTDKKPLWGLGHDSDVEDGDRYALRWTFDRAMVAIADWEKFATKVSRLSPHLDSFIEICEKYLESSGTRLVGFGATMTTVSEDLWEVPDEDSANGDETRPYDYSRDKDNHPVFMVVE